MKFPHHLFRLVPAPRERDSERVQVVTRHDAADQAPLFRAPALPTLHQLSSELPFTVNFRARLRPRV